MLGFASLIPTYELSKKNLHEEPLGYDNPGNT